MILGELYYTSMFSLKPWWPPFLASGHHFILSRCGHFHLPGVTIKWKFSPWVNFIYYTCSVGHATACFPQKSNLYAGKTTAKVWLLLPCEFTRPLSLSHLSGLYREQSANKINCLEEQPISVPSMSVKGKGRLITCAKEQFWALRPNTALLMCWENSLGNKEVIAHKLPLENALCNALSPAPWDLLGKSVSWPQPKSCQGPF